jgi:O-acetyl-ADP-ribose deacetylase (regulator of RNase III)
MWKFSGFFDTIAFDAVWRLIYMPLSIVRDDITKMNVDAIVNAANTSLQESGDICGAIFSAADTDRLQAACNELAPIKTGEAVITKGYALPAKHIIHVAWPSNRNGTLGKESLLRDCYRNALNLAVKHDCESVAFPLISSGTYGYQKGKELTAATHAIGEWLMKNSDISVFLVVFDRATYIPSQKLLGKLKSYINKNYVDEREELHRRDLRDIEQREFIHREFSSQRMAREPRLVPLPSASPKKFSEQLDEPFTATLLRLIDAKGKTDVEIYKRANIDRKLFSKIRTGKGYMPSKKTAVALAIALELSLNETRSLLERAGYALSHSVLFDVIIEYFIKNKKYDIFEINNVLFEYDQPLLGG